MFDLRYHVASLAAVFLALVIGILVGVGISGRGALNERERLSLENDIRDLRAQTEDQRRRIDELEGAAAYEQATEEAVLEDRLSERRVALVFVGSVDGAVRTAVEQMLDDAGGSMTRVRALRVPIDFVEVEDALVGVPGAPSRPEDIGRALAQEFLDGGETPLWDELASNLVEERDGGMTIPVDAVVVARSTEAQRGPTARFLGGFYSGLASGGRPAVAVETSDADESALPVLVRYGFSSVNNVETPTGRVSLAVLLAGDDAGHYGINAEDGYVPDVDPVAPSG
jgi:hypothetical protein